MKLTVQTDYALRVLIHAGLQNGALVRVADIAQSFAISRHHLTKVVHRLGGLGYLTTVQGRHGGITLATAPERIVVGQVVRDMEADLAVVECLGATTSCPIAPSCRLKRAMRDATSAFLETLDELTLADLLRPPLPLRQSLGLTSAPGSRRGRDTEPERVSHPVDTDDR